MSDKKEAHEHKEEHHENKKHTEKNTGMAVLAYIIFFVPLLTDAKKDKFVMFHVKQGLVLFISFVAMMFVGMILVLIPFLGWLLDMILYLTLLILLVIGIMNALNGEEKELPFIGKYAKSFKF